MGQIRTLALCLVLALTLAPASAMAQGASATPDLDARIAALESAVAALQKTVAALRAGLNDRPAERREGASGDQATVESETRAAIASVQSVLTPFVWFASDVFEGDVVGTYAVLLLGASGDSPPTRATSFLFKGTATIREGGTGTMTLTLGGTAAPAAPDQTPSAAPAATLDLSWTLDSVTQTVHIQPAAALGDFELFVTVGAKTLLGAKSQDNTHQLFIFTRQP